MGKIIEREEIKLMLPHRGRALLLDKVELNGNNATGYLTIKPEHCEGHIPGFLIMRAVDRIEMIALTLGIAVRSELLPGYIALLAIIGKARFPGVAFPDDLVRSEVTIQRKISHMFQGSGKAFVGDKLIAEVQKLTCLIRKIPEVK